MSKYLSRISQDEKAKKSEANILAEAHAKAEVEQKVSQLKSKKATLNAAYEAALGANPFSVNRVFDLKAEIAQNVENLKTAEALLADEFGE